MFNFDFLCLVYSHLLILFLCNTVSNYCSWELLVNGFLPSWIEPYMYITLSPHLLFIINFHQRCIINSLMWEMIFSPIQISTYYRLFISQMIFLWWKIISINNTHYGSGQEIIFCTIIYYFTFHDFLCPNQINKWTPLSIKVQDLGLQYSLPISIQYISNTVWYVST